VNRSTLAVTFAALVGLASASCINQARQAVAPEPDGTGTLACREIVEQCDSQCGDPFCIQRCSGQGTPDGAAQHQALVDCGQRNSCTDQDCMQANCPGEIQTCMGEAAAPDGNSPDTSAPDTSAPGQTEPQPAPAM
jgi:hypothetical protein